MGRDTMTFALPRPMRQYIDARVRDGSFGNTSEYLRDLVRRDQQEQAALHLRSLIADGISSGVGRAVTPDVLAELRAAAMQDDE